MLITNNEQNNTSIEIKMPLEQETTANSKIPSSEITNEKLQFKRAIARIHCSSNNTLIAITVKQLVKVPNSADKIELEQIVVSGSAGNQFKGTRKSTTHASYMTGVAVAKSCVAHDIKLLDVILKGSKKLHVKSTLMGLLKGGVYIDSVLRLHNEPFNGCRGKKRRRI